MILINNADNKNFIGSPHLTRMNGSDVYWQMKSGEINTIGFKQWRWSQLGIGTLLIVLLLILNLILQRIRLDMGFGFPELPP